MKIKQQHKKEKLSVDTFINIFTHLCINILGFSFLIIVCASVK